MRSTVFCALAVCAVGGLASCGSAEEPAARDAALLFLSRADSDLRGACALLAPRTAERLAEDADGDCSSALAEAGLEGPSDVEGVTVAGSSALVRMAGNMVFLARFDEGWRVTAAGCTRTSEDDAAPYDCEVQD